MTLDELNAHFGLPGVLAFDQHGELTRAQVTLPACTATVYLHGAHLAAWQPTGAPAVLFLAARSEFAPGKAIRGGIPVCWPWFGPDTEHRDAGKPGPSHGFARTMDWELAFAALVPGTPDQLRLTFTLGPSDTSRRFGFNDFRVAYDMIFAGTTCTLRLSVANPGTAPLRFEEALHTYFHVADVREATLTGLESAKFLDKTDGMQARTGPAEPLQLTGWADRVYPTNTANTIIEDLKLNRTISVAKTNSATTIVWNPWDKASAALPDMGPEEWPGFLCVETANAGADAITLLPGEAHTMEAILTVAPC